MMGRLSFWRRGAWRKQFGGGAFYIMRVMILHNRVEEIATKVDEALGELKLFCECVSRRLDEYENFLRGWGGGAELIRKEKEKEEKEKQELSRSVQRRRKVQQQ